MLRGDDHRREVGELFSAAALGGDWEAALNGFADACGGAHGQLMGVSATPAIRFNWSPRLAPRALDEFAAIGGAEPAANPRMRMGLRLSVLEPWHEADGLDRPAPGVSAPMPTSAGATTFRTAVRRPWIAILPD